MKNPKHGSGSTGTVKELRLLFTRLQAEVRLLKKELRRKKQQQRLKGRAAEAAAFWQLEQRLAREEQNTLHKMRGKRTK